MSNADAAGNRTGRSNVAAIMGAVRGSVLLLVGVVGLLACARADQDPAREQGQSGVDATAATDPLVNATASEPATTTTLAVRRLDGCRTEPVVHLTNGAEALAMDLVYYEESTATCGYNADGDAMFDDAFRPIRALPLAPERCLAITVDELGDVTIDVRPLEAGMRLAAIEPSADVLAVGDDGTYRLALPADGCVVVTVGWRADGRHAQLTGLAASGPSTCESR